MLTSTRQSLIVATALIAIVAGSGQAHAAPITFDAAITSAPGQTPDPELCALCTAANSPGLLYSPGQGSPLVFATQGFNFGGSTQGVTAGTTLPDLAIILDRTRCPATFGTPCASDGTHYLATIDPFGMFSPGSQFAISSFQASQLFGPGGCPAPNCDQTEALLNATSVQVTGFRGGGVTIVAQETFLLSSIFQTFVLSDPDWMNVSRVVFLPVSATGAPVSALALDNIDVVQVPEPASLVLFATGIAALAARRRAARRAR